MALATQSWGEGPSLVFIHGWRAHSGLWYQWVKANFIGYRVTLIDLPGHGDSPPISRKKDSELIDDWLEAIIEVLPEHSILVGWSLGGLLVQQLAIRYPQHVSALILIASSPCFVERDDWKPALSRPLIHQYIQEVANNTVALFKSFFMLQSLGSPNPKRLYQQLVSTLLVLTTDVASLKQGLTLLEVLDLRSELHQISQPMLWLFGEKDAIVPVALSVALADLLPTARHETLTNCGHLPFMTCPDRLATVMCHFLVGLSDD